jgi:hypothetical protein
MTSRRLAAAALALLWTGIAAAQVPTGRTIDLDAPGALAALEQSNPAHHDTVRRILTGIVDRRDTEVPRWMQATFAAHDVTYTPVVLTSDPPKRRLSFVLDTTRYQTIVTLTNVRGEIVPLK